MVNKTAITIILPQNQSPEENLHVGKNKMAASSQQQVPI